jgi:hypothetical protein
MTERTQLNVNISPELLKVLKQNAIKSGLTLAKYVTKLIQAYVSNEDLIEEGTLVDKRIDSMESQLNEIAEKLNNFNNIISNSPYKEEKEEIPVEAISPKIAFIPKKPSTADVKKIGTLIAQHFKQIQRTEVLSAKEAWQLFKDQECIKLIKEEHLTLILDVLRGEKILTFGDMQTLGLEYESCPVMKAFRTMSDLPIQSEFSQIKNEAEMYLAHLASKQNKKFEMSV